MCFILKEIVVCSCNMLFDFFLRYAILSGNTMYSGVFKGRRARHLPRAPLFEVLRV